MKNSIMIARLLGGVLVLLGIASVASPQTASTTSVAGVPANEDMVVYAKAGRINLTDGEVRSRRTDRDPGQLVTTGYEIAVGDIVSTGSGARLEVLLNPGAFLRLGENAEFQMLSTDLTNVHFVLRRGSALVETGGNKKFYSRIRVSTPSGLAFLSSGGLYRVDIVPEGTIFAAVKGALMLGSKTLTLRDGERVTVTGAGAGQVAQIDQSATPDALASWSHERSNQLAEASRRMDRKRLEAALRRAVASNVFVGSFRGQAGIWGADGASGSYTFIPLLSDWRSPYGSSYSNLSASSAGRYTSGFNTGMVPGPRGFPTPPMRLQDPKPPPPPPLPTRPPGSN